MTFDNFVEKILEVFGENAIVHNNREEGLYEAKFDEWRISMNASGKRIRYYNVRSKVNFCEEF